LAASLIIFVYTTAYIAAQAKQRSRLHFLLFSGSLPNRATAFSLRLLTTHRYSPNYSANLIRDSSATECAGWVPMHHQKTTATTKLITSAIEAESTMIMLGLSGTVAAASL